MNISSFDESFLKTLERWLGDQAEILVLIRYSHAGGSKSFEFFSSFAVLSGRLRQLPPRTSVTAFRKPQLPLRGIVDDQFIARCLNRIPESSEFLVVETAHRTAGKASWTHESAGVSHTELRDALEDSRDRSVAVGPYPPWLEESHDVVSAIVPDEDGVLHTGVY
jgi:hypothetical protein